VQWRGLAVVSALGLAGYGIVFFVGPPPGPAPRALCRGAEVVRAEHRAEDAIWLLPSYATRAREFLGDLRPLAPTRPEAEDVQTHPRVFVLGLLGAADRVAPALRAAGLVREATSNEAGVQLERWRNPRVWTVREDLTSALSRARVELLRPGGERRACDRRGPRTGQGGDGPRLECPIDSDWQYVAAEWHRMGDHPRRCLWAHPPNEGELWIHFPDVPLEGELSIRGGHTLHSSRHARAPVELTVRIGPTVEQYAFGLRDTWRSARADLSAVARVLGTDTATVSFGVWSSDPGINHFCFAADVRVAEATGT